MPKRFSRRLAGFTAIELLLVTGLGGAGYEFQAGTASVGRVKALALADRRGHRAVIAQAEFPVTRAVADFAAAQLMKAYDLDRAGILLRGASAGEAAPADLVTASAAALGKLEPARVLHGSGSLSVTTPDGRCRAAVSADGALAFEGCRGGGKPARGPIRMAFQMADLTHGLQQRRDPLRAYPVQAIALGKLVTILALGGSTPAGLFRSPGIIVAPFANDTMAMPDDPRVHAAIRQVLARVGSRDSR